MVQVYYYLLRVEKRFEIRFSEFSAQVLTLWYSFKNLVVQLFGMPVNMTDCFRLTDFLGHFLLYSLSVAVNVESEHCLSRKTHAPK
jgi:hypothetical protein